MRAKPIFWVVVGVVAGVLIMETLRGIYGSNNRGFRVTQEISATNLPDPGLGTGPIGGVNKPEQAAQAYDNFINKARLSPDQKTQFDQALVQIRQMYLDNRSATAEEAHNTVNREAYQKVKRVLTPNQYMIFVEEIGSTLPYIAIVQGDRIFHSST